MNFAICDFSRKTSLQLKKSLLQLWPEAKIDVFHECTPLMGRIRHGKEYDILFLDVFVLHMKLPDGSDIVNEVRRALPRAELVFLSASGNYGMEAFQRKALYCLTKPGGRSELLEIRSRFHAKHVPETEVYDSLTHQTYRLPYENIIYIESVRNYLHIHLGTGSVMKVRGSLSGFMEKLDERFLRINRGIIVNMEKVEQMNIDSCKIDGLIFMLSRNRRVENRQKYYKYRFTYQQGGDEYK